MNESVKLSFLFIFSYKSYPSSIINLYYFSTTNKDGSIDYYLSFILIVSNWFSLIIGKVNLIGEVSVDK